MWLVPPHTSWPTRPSNTTKLAIANFHITNQHLHLHPLTPEQWAHQSFYLINHKTYKTPSTKTLYNALLPKFITKHNNNHSEITNASKALKIPYRNKIREFHYLTALNSCNLDKNKPCTLCNKSPNNIHHIIKECHFLPNLPNSDTHLLNYAKWTTYNKILHESQTPNKETCKNILSSHYQTQLNKNILILQLYASKLSNEHSSNSW